MKKLLIILTITLTGCTKNQDIQKPCIVIFKECYFDKCLYEVQDRNNRINQFTDTIGKYSIGDILN